MIETIDTNVYHITDSIILNATDEINESLARFIAAMTISFFDVNTQHEKHAPFINGITCIIGPGLA